MGLICRQILFLWNLDLDVSFPNKAMFFSNSSLRYALLGFSDFPFMQMYLFLIFLIMYLLTVLGNLVILSCVVFDQRLHSPMYYFLGNLSLVDICFTSSTIPTLLSSFVSDARSLSFPACITQMFSFITFGNLENNLLAVMAYDRYVAICSPLQYTKRMRSSVCVALVFTSWVGAFAHSLLHTLKVAALEFNGVKQINHFFCEISQLLSISSSDTSINFLLIQTEGAVSVGIPFICITMSYTKIVVALVRLRSKGAQLKALSTCSSHLTTVCLFYGTIVSVYFRPYASSSGVGERAATIGYTLLTPMLNPFIYGLRNKAVKSAAGKAWQRKLSAN
ncbi:olfactory receptor 1361-like [Spea bombifrons]|uniref:olfactory receptor 1361-like n=1 Tax=Spea bombifrons TaxID=233779 RepID=UPI002349DE68|nr:olfactory receptor 1361-like [Spea bombifrons]